jgi:hypothetical protein
MNQKTRKSFPIGRDSQTGRLMPVERARNRPDAQVERMPTKGNGDTKRKG